MSRMSQLIAFIALLLSVAFISGCSATTDDASPEIENNNSSSDGNNNGDGGNNNSQPSQAPLAVPDQYRLDKNVTGEDLLVLDNDQGSEIFIDDITPPDQGGTVTINPDDLTLKYTANAGFTGREQFHYFIRNDDNAPSSTTVTIDIVDPNLVPGPPPTAVLDPRFFPTNSMNNVINALNNDLTSAGVVNPDNLVITSVSSFNTVPPDADPGDADRIRIIDGAAIEYDTIPGFVGVETLLYEITDITTGETSPGFIVITVSPLANTPPIAIADARLALIPHTGDANVYNVLSNDLDSEGNTGTANLIITEIEQVSLVTAPPPNNDSFQDRVDISGDGQNITYIPPDIDTAAVETIRYTIEDINTNETSFTTLIVTITPELSLPPVAVIDIEATGVNQTLVIPATDNDLDANGVNNVSNLTIISVTSEQLILPVDNDNPSDRIEFTADSITYDPPADFTGVERLTYVIRDNTTLQESEGSIIITVSPLGSIPPVAVPDIGFVVSGTTTPATFAVLGNDFDSGGNQANATTVTINSAVQNTLLPPADDTDNPADRIDFDPDTGEIIYTPPANFVAGIEIIEYTITDNNTGGMATGLLTITIRPGTPNVPPVGLPSTETTPQGVPGNWMVSAIDANQDDLAYRVDTQADGGSISMQVNGSYVFTPEPDFVGLYTFSFIANDGNEDSVPTNVFIVVTPNLPPIATTSSQLFDQDSDAADNSAVVTATDIDTAAADITYRVITDPVLGSPTITDGTGTVPTSNGTLEFNADGTYTYEPNDGFFGEDGFYFVANDGNNDSALPGRVIILVSPLPTNVPPLAISDIMVVDFEEAQNNQFAGTDLNAGDTLTFAIATDPANGNITNFDSATGNFTYTPNDGYFGEDTIAFTVSDGSATSIAGNVLIVVVPVGTNVAPLAAGGAYQVATDEQVSGQLLAVDANGDTITYEIVQGPSAGTLTAFDANTGQFTYDATGVASSLTPVTFTYRANDGTADSNEATISILILPLPLPNTVPVAVPQLIGDPATVSIATGTNNGTFEGQLIGLDVDGPDLLTFALAGTAQAAPIPVATGTFTVSNFMLDTDTGEFSFEPEIGGIGVGGSYTFTFTVNDGEATSEAATVTIIFSP